jgi:hypothetical protein
MSAQETTPDEIVETVMHKNWVTKGYEEPNLFQKTGDAMHRQSSTAMHFLWPTDDNGKWEPNKIMIGGGCLGLAGGLAVGLFAAYGQVDYELHKDHASTALRTLRIIVGTPLAPPLCIVIGGMFGMISGALLSVAASTYAVAYGGLGMAVRGAADFCSAANTNFKPKSQEAVRIDINQQPQITRQFDPS